MAREQVEVSVLIAIPHFMTRELLVGALRRNGGFRVFDGATTSHEVLEAVQSSNVDVALINATLADGPLSGFGCITADPRVLPGRQVRNSPRRPSRQLGRRRIPGRRKRRLLSFAIDF